MNNMNKHLCPFCLIRVKKFKRTCGDYFCKKKLQAVNFRNWVSENKKRYMESQRKYKKSEKGKKVIKRLSKKYRENNREELRAYFRDYYQKNKEKYLLRNKAQYRKKKERLTQGEDKGSSLGNEQKESLSIGKVRSV